mgnify:CR=1 FL=1|tara:strand:+ start:44 stop:265 length:222 start_codon:yes stop_codon:yes gene_type:complete
MGLFKWLLSKFSCNSSCKYNAELAGCPKRMNENIENIMNYNLSIKDVLKINKLLSKRENYENRRESEVLSLTI